MGFRVKKTNFADAVTRADSVLSLATMMPGNDLIVGVSGGELIAEAVGADASFVGRYPAEGSDMAPVVVNGRKAREIVPRMPGDEIEVREEGSHVVLLSGGSRFTIATKPLGDSNRPPAVNEEAWIEVPVAALQQAVDGSSYAAATNDDSRYMLQGTLLEFRDGKVTGSATDGHRLARTSRDLGGAASELDGSSFVLSAKGVDELKRLLATTKGSDAATVSFQVVSPARVAARIGGLTYVLSLIERESYPNVTQVIPAGERGQVVTMRRGDLHEALQRAALIYATREAPAVKMTAEEGGAEVVLESRDPGIGEAREVVALPSPAPAGIKIGFSSRLLLGALSSYPLSEVDNVRMTFDGDSGPIGIESPDDHGYVGVVMPFRVNW